MHKNADDAFNSIYQIEQTLLRREPTISRWRGYHMANTDSGISIGVINVIAGIIFCNLFVINKGRQIKAEK